MLNQFFTYGFGVPTIFIIVNLTIFLVFTLLRERLATPFKEVRTAWLTFMKKGIPIPADYKRFDNGITGKAVLTQPVFEARRNDPVTR